MCSVRIIFTIKKMKIQVFNHTPRRLSYSYRRFGGATLHHFSVLALRLFGGVMYNGFGETNFIQVLVVQILKTKFNRNSFCILDVGTFGQAAADFGLIDQRDAV